MIKLRKYLLNSLLVVIARVKPRPLKLSLQKLNTRLPRFSLLVDQVLLELDLVAEFLIRLMQSFLILLDHRNNI